MLSTRDPLQIESKGLKNIYFMQMEILKKAGVAILISDK